MICSICKKKLRLGGDHSYEDCDRKGEGMVGFYTCPNPKCEVEDILIYTKIDEVRD